MKRRSFNRAASVSVIAVALAGLLTVGCKPAPLQFNSTDITGASFASGFSLTDHTGKAVQLTDYAGKAVIVFFGFTHCPDVCPGTLIEMKAVMEKLGDQAGDVQVVFITVDPERDTQEVLSQYVPAFDKRFVGLRGDLQATKAVTREFKVYFGKVPGTTEGSYTIDHTAASYVFDREGKVRLMIKPDAGVEAIVADLKTLLTN
ncbi:MAG: SCO family protein [Burkholderiaceae bacterium]